MKKILLAIGFIVMIPLSATADVDWGKIPAKKITLFYPGVISWEFLTQEEHKTAASSVIKGEKACQDCHVKEGKFDIYADDIVGGKMKMRESKNEYEPDPPVGLQGFKALEMQAAYDSDYMYMRFTWPSKEGISYKDPSLYSKGLTDRIAIQLNANLKPFAKNGCFISCHNDNAFMPLTPDPEIVSSVPFYSNQKRKDVRLYAHFTRLRGWDKIRPEQEMDKLIKAGAILDLWVAGFKGNEVVTSDESIFYDRVQDQRQNLEAQGEWKDGFYTLIVKRKLLTDDPMDMQIQEGKGFVTGIAIYDNKNGNRKHYVSFPLSISLGEVEADIRAYKLSSTPPVSGK